MLVILLRVTCDNCNQNELELKEPSGGDYYDTKEDLIRELLDMHDWHLLQDVHLCKKCVESIKGKIGRDARC